MAHVINTKKSKNYGFQEDGTAFGGTIEQIQAS
jgi:hypothetical protein